MKKANCSEKLVAFGGDNCNTNLGGSERREMNVFCLLKEDKYIEGIGCLAHIINNCIQCTVDCLSIDVESILCKIFNYFSINTVRVETLKEFSEYVDIDYKVILSHSDIMAFIIPSHKSCFTNV